MENDLVNQFNKRNQEALKVLFFDMYRLLLTIAIKQIHDDHYAKDIVLMSFHRLWMCDKKFTTLMELKNFLVRIALNACIDHNRRKRVEFVGDDKLLERPMPEVESLDKNLICLLYERVYSLTPQLRKVLLLELDGHSVQDIARIQKVKIDTVYYSRWKAIQKLRELFKIK